MAAPQLFQELAARIAEGDHPRVLLLAQDILAKHPSDLEALNCLLVAAVKSELPAGQILERVQKAKYSAGNEFTRFLLAYLHYLAGKPFVPKEANQHLAYGQFCFKAHRYEDSFNHFYTYLEMTTGFNRKNVSAQGEVLVTQTIVDCLAALAAGSLKETPRLDQLLQFSKSFKHSLEEWAINLAMMGRSSQLDKVAADSLSPEDAVLVAYVRLYEKYRQGSLSFDQLAGFLAGEEARVKDLPADSRAKFLYSTTQVFQKWVKGEATSDALKKLEEFCRAEDLLTLPQLVTLTLNRISLSIEKNREDSARIAEGLLKRVGPALQCDQRFLANLWHPQVRKRLKLQNGTGPATLFRRLLECDEDLTQLVRLCREPGVPAVSILKYVAWRLRAEDSPKEELLSSFLETLGLVQDQELLGVSFPLVSRLTNQELAKQLMDEVFKSQMLGSHVLRMSQAKYYFEAGQIDRAEELLQKELEMAPREDWDQAALEQLALKEEAEDSPQKQKKLKKIKKRKTRLPKGYNPANPGPLPNPERWLPRCERKEFRKKANLKSGKTQGSTNVGKEQMNLFGGKGQVRNKGRGRRAE